MSLESLRKLPEKDDQDKRLSSARLFFWRVVATWAVVGLVLTFVGVQLLVSHTAYKSAFAYNAREQWTASLMWHSYCTKQLHEVSAEECDRQLGRPLDCRWASTTHEMDIVQQSVQDAGVYWLSKFGHIHLLEPVGALYLMLVLYALSWVVPFVAAWYYFRETRRRIELAQKAFNSTLTTAQRASLHNILDKRD